MMLAALLAAACLPVSGPNITAKDISAAVPGFAPVEATASFGYSPSPGVQRVVHPGELQRFLTQQGYTGAMPMEDVCFARPTKVLSEAAVVQAMQTALGGGAHIEVVELSRFPAPDGEIVFPREDIGAPPVALWHGYVRYDKDKKFPVWARVKVTMRTTRVMAVEDLRPGAPIKPYQVALETVEDFPGRRTTPASVDKVDGALPRRYIAANTPVWTDSFDPPNAVTKGDRVSVMVTSGNAHLMLDAEAEMSGRLGDVVSFKNPESGRVFRARIEGPGKATLNTP